MKIVRKARPLESEVQAQAMDWCELNRILCFRRNVMAMGGSHKGKRWFVRAGEPGQSDLWGVLPSLGHVFPVATRHFEAEAKRPGERPTLDQIRWLIRMNDYTGAAFWFDSLSVFVKVMERLIEGGYIEYHQTQRRYGEAMGPSGDYDIVRDEP